jgi:predicted tellurium resistance membrane protein TerC
VIFPGANFFLSLKQKITKLDKWDIACGILGVLSIAIWYITRKTPHTVQYANYIAILADLCAIIPTYRLVKSNPMVEKPLPWITFSIGFGLSVFAITEHTIANYALPIYMFLGAGVIAIIQMEYRIKTNNTEKWY